MEDHIYGESISFQKESFPIPLLKHLYFDVKELFFPNEGVLVTQEDDLSASRKVINTINPEKLAPGLLLVAGSINGTRHTFVQILDRDGTVIHEWQPNWNEIWGNKSGDFNNGQRPNGKIGAYLHGLDILPDASLVANFEHLSTFRIDACGDVKLL